MAKMYNGILGNLSGKIGNVNTFPLFDFTVIRSIPNVRIDAKTAPQLEHRAIFASINSFLNQVYYPVIRTLLGLTLGLATPYFKFSKLNFSYFDSSGLILPSSLIISKGNLLSFDNFRLLGVSGGGVAFFGWDDNSDDLYAFPDDMFYGFMFNHDLQHIQMVYSHPFRDDELVSQQMPGNWTAQHDIYMFSSFLKFNGLLSSDNIAYVF